MTAPLHDKLITTKHPSMKPSLAAFFLALASSVVAAAEPTTLGSHEGATRVAVSVDGAFAASTGGKTVKIWDIKSGKLVRELPIESSGIALAFAPDTKAIAVRLEHAVELLDLESGKSVRRFEAHVGGVPRIAISPDGKWLASGGSDNKVRLWELPTGKLAHELAHNYHLVFGVQFSADSKRLITGGGDGVATHGEVKSWEVDTGGEVWRYEAKQIWMVAVLPDASAAVSIDVAGAVVFHDWKTGAKKREIKTGDQCRALAVSADGKWLAATARNSIQLWNLVSNELASPLQGHENWVLSLAFTPDASALISGSSDATARLWRLR